MTAHDTLSHAREFLAWLQADPDRKFDMGSWKRCAYGSFLLETKKFPDVDAMLNALLERVRTRDEPIVPGISRTHSFYIFMFNTDYGYSQYQKAEEVADRLAVVICETEAEHESAIKRGQVLTET